MWLSADTAVTSFRAFQAEMRLRNTLIVSIIACEKRETQHKLAEPKDEKRTVDATSGALQTEGANRANSARAKCADAGQGKEYAHLQDPAEEAS